MSKKPQRQEKNDLPAVEPIAETIVADSPTDADAVSAAVKTDEKDTVTGDAPEPSMGNGSPEAQPESDNSSLLDEVQAFFHQREELAEKLAKEIEATEAKLAELTLTMSQLFPDRPANPGKDRRAKKPRKSPPRNQAEAGEPKPGQ